MTKPRNFPGRRYQRMMKARDEDVSAEIGKRFTKKTPKASWSAARAAQRGGKIGR